MKPCAQPGCPTLVAKGTTRCLIHRRAQDKAIKQRDRNERAVYFTKRWQGLRRTVRQNQGPWCATEGCTRLWTDLDHVIPIRDGGTEDMENLSGLCHPCHSAKTMREVMG